MRKRVLAAWAVLLFLFLVGMVFNINLGSVHIPIREIFQMVGNGIRLRVAAILGGDVYAKQLAFAVGGSMQAKIVFSIRLPRMMLAAVLGGALAVSGFLLQTFFRNPIAGPFVLGISSGAKLVVSIALVFLPQCMKRFGSAAMILSAFAGSLLIVFVVLFFSQKVRSMSMLLVIGIMMGYICSAITDFCIAFAKENEIVNLTSWSMGSFSGANWDHVAVAAWICLPGLFAAWL